MHRLPVSLLSVVLVVAAAACVGSAAAPSTAPRAVASTIPASSPPTAAPTASPTLAPAVAVAVPSGAQTSSLYEWKVIAATAIRSGKSNFTISNFGNVPHELLVFKSPLDPSAYPTDAAGNIKEEGGGVLLVSDGENIDPGGSQVRTIDLKPGKYVFVCNIPGHFKAGMFTVVTISN